jgi:hypothetical protein
VVNETKKDDQIVEVKVDGLNVKMRVLKFALDSGEQETLITNLFEEEFSIVDFKALYFKRWGIEVKYHELKNKLQLENFTGDTPVAVEQDFYAAMYLTNMVAIAKAEANQKIEQENEGKGLMHEYKVNTSILIGKLKDSLVLMLLEDSPRKRSKILTKIMKEITQNTIPIRPGRNNPRKITARAHKYPINQKKSL